MLLNVALLPGHSVSLPVPVGATLSMKSSPPGGECVVMMSAPATSPTPVAQNRHTMGSAAAVPAGATHATFWGVPGNYVFNVQ